MTKWTMKRRDLLQGLGAGAALLPLLPNARARGAAPEFPRRLIIVVYPNGFVWGKYVPKGDGEDLSNLTLSSSLAGFNAWKKQLVMMAPMLPASFPEDAHRNYSLMLSGSGGESNPQLGKEPDFPKSATVDQVIGDALLRRDNLAMRSLALRTPWGTSDPDALVQARYSCWIGRAQPVTPEVSPYKVMDTLFAGKKPDDPGMQRIRAERKSMLDFLDRDLQKFAGQLGSDDRLVVQGHLQGIRDLERQLSTPPAGATQSPAAPTSSGQPLDPNSMSNFPAMFNLQSDVMVAALRSDATRVATLQVGPAWGNGMVFKWLDCKEVWHEAAHHQSPEKEKIETWLVTQFAGLLQRLNSVPEVGAHSRTMLDNTAVLFATTMLDGGHEPHMPWMLAGSCGGYFKTGQYLRGAANKHIQNVLVDVCNAMGLPVTYFGNQNITGGVPGLAA